ncbi:MAG TPA: signal peptidase I [Terriglobales bacterium]|jgi:signal peptidase I
MTMPIEAPPVPAISATKAAHHSDWAFVLQSFLVVIVIAVFAITFIVQAFQIPSDSMENTLLVGDYLLVDKLCYGANPGAFFMPYRPVKRGDIIVFKFPVDPTQHFVKRVVGVPGDHVRLINRTVYVNGIALREPYTHHISSITDDFRDNFPQLNLSVAGLEGKWWLQMKTLVKDDELVVPPNDYFVLGDNRDDSEDSRYWGFVPRANIVGRPLIVYWSMREADSDGAPAGASDKLLHLAYGITHFYQITRWNRTFLVVR